MIRHDSIYFSALLPRQLLLVQSLDYSRSVVGGKIDAFISHDKVHEIYALRLNDTTILGRCAC